MRRFLTLAVFFCLLASIRADGPEDQYVDIYNQILQADSLKELGHSTEAARAYSLAQTALQKLRDSHPAWNSNIVSFRLDYLSTQVAGLAQFLPHTNAPVSTPAATQATGQGQTADLQDKIRQLTAANEELNKKLQEALGVQPAALDPRALEKAQDKIAQLQKDNELLKVSFDQARSDLSQAQADLKKSGSGRKSSSGSENPSLKKQLADATNQIVSLTKQLADAEAKQDELTLQAHSQQNSGTPSAENSAALDEVNRLRSRLALFEAAAVPYSPEELAMLNPQAGQPLTNIPSPSPAGLLHSNKDLPPGAGALMADAQRATLEHDYQLAEAKYKEVLTQDQDNIFVLVHLAEAQFGAAQLADCETTIKHALSLDPNDAAGLYLLGVLRYRQQRLDEALAALTRSATFNATNPGTQNYLGCVLCDKGMRLPAETALRAALRFDPDYADAHYNLAFVYATEKPPFTALARWHYKKALDLGHAKNEDLEKILANLQ